MADENRAVAAAAGTIDLGGDLTVCRLGFGAMRITGTGIWGDPPDLDAARDVLRRAVELGVNFIDTADSYGPEVSERLIGEALSPYPDDLVIATKGGLERPGPGRWTPNGRPEHLISACEGSLRRLRLDQIPLYQFHRPDPAVPLEDSVGALVDLKDQGKIRHIGLSNVSEDQLRRAQQLTPIVSIQNRYNLTDRGSESLVDLCEQEQIAFLPWAPIQGLDDVSVVVEIAERHEASQWQVALAWLLARSPAMLVIPGTGSWSHLEETSPPLVSNSVPTRSPRSTRCVGVGGVGSPRGSGRGFAEPVAAADEQVAVGEVVERAPGQPEVPANLGNHLHRGGLRAGSTRREEVPPLPEPLEQLDGPGCTAVAMLAFFAEPAETQQRPSSCGPSRASRCDRGTRR